VVWRYRWNEKRWAKPPLNPCTGHLARTDNPETWASFEEALQAYQQSRRWGPNGSDVLDGIGLVLVPGGGLGAVDLDSACDADGQPTSWASELLDAVGSYTERSPSGHGFRVFTLGEPLVRVNRPYQGGRVELYPGPSPQYLTVTGQLVLGRPDRLAEATTLAALCQRFQSRSPSARPPMARGPQLLAKGETARPVEDAEDAALLARARNAQNGVKFRALYDRGDLTEHDGDRSRADLALCCLLAFWTHSDSDRIDRLFRRSALMRPKWNGRRGDVTYGALTIRRAIEYSAEGKDEPPSAVPPAAPVVPEVHLTDTGNASRFCTDHCLHLRYVADWKCWLVWDGSCWRRDDTGVVWQRAKQTAARIYQEGHALARQRELSGAGAGDTEEE
jgi:primase-polymerase (primpol)-like protein